MDPNELKEMIDAIRNVELALSGNGKKEVSTSEEKNKAIVRKSIVAKSGIKKGEILTAQNITIKRPGDGISPMKWYDVMGQIASKDYEADDLI